MYGNLRTENMIIQLDHNEKEIEDVKFLNFGNMVKFAEGDYMTIPERIEHLPPEFLKHLLNMDRFEESGSQSNLESPSPR